MNSNVKRLRRPHPMSTIFSPPFHCPFYFLVSNAGENVTCHDPSIGVGEPGKVIQKLCQFSNRSSRGGPVGGIVTYTCVGSKWNVKRNDCISAPINSLLRLAKVILQLLSLSAWWGDLSSLSYFSALRKVSLGLVSGGLKATFICRIKLLLFVEMLKTLLKYKYEGNRICALLYNQLYTFT